jgi:hypothetical protein
MSRRPSFVRPVRPRGRLGIALVLACAFTFAFGVGPAIAAADELGAIGRVVKVEVRTSGSDDRATAHGRVSLRRANGKTEFYEWGGSSCPAAKLTESEVGMLERAFHNRSRTLVTPRYRPGEASGVRCLVGFELSAV